MTNRPWFPTIFLDKCDCCNGTYKCVNFCPHKVLEIREDKVAVVNPLGCIYACTSCANLCPKDAIIFPSRSTISRTIKKKSSLNRVICKVCGNRFLSNRDIEYCFDCENLKRNVKSNEK